LAQRIGVTVAAARPRVKLSGTSDSRDTPNPRALRRWLKLQPGPALPFTLTCRSIAAYLTASLRSAMRATGDRVVRCLPPALARLEESAAMMASISSTSTSMSRTVQHQERGERPGALVVAGAALDTERARARFSKVSKGDALARRAAP
jgi:hypothetical protein